MLIWHISILVVHEKKEIFPDFSLLASPYHLGWSLCTLPTLASLSNCLTCWETSSYLENMILYHHFMKQWVHPLYCEKMILTQTSSFGSPLTARCTQDLVGFQEAWHTLRGEMVKMMVLVVVVVVVVMEMVMVMMMVSMVSIIYLSFRVGRWPAGSVWKPFYRPPPDFHKTWFDGNRTWTCRRV